jgi:ABC-type bacteriocin/lantibiotic exporter with double-glycine peptidase domain
LKTFLIKTLKLIPGKRRKKLPFFISISLLNTLLDFISIALLVPFILLIFDKEKSKGILRDLFSIELTTSHLIIGLSLLLLFYIIKNYVQIKIITKQSKFIYSIASDLSKNLINNYLYGNYAKQMAQDKGRLIRDFQKLPVVFATHILMSLYIIMSELFIIGIVVIISFISAPQLTVFSFFLIIACTLSIIALRNKKTTYLNKVIAKSYKDSLNQIMNIFNGFIQIKSAKTEKQFENKFNEVNKKNNEYISMLSVFRQSNIRYLEIFIIAIISILVIYIQLSASQVIDIVLLSFLISAIIKLIPSFNKLITSYIEIRANQHAVDILNEYDIQPKTSKNGLTFLKTIELKSIHLSYNKKDTILSDISLTINRGDFIAITGDSGIGKTSLLRIISGVLSPNKGTIFIDGVKNNYNVFNPFCTFVTQQSYLFHGTLLENITMLTKGRIDIDWIQELMHTFELTDWVEKLSHKFETKIDLDSKTISGGQKQRIALIRALYSKPKLLLLDEATNQLDNHMENKILSYLKNLTDHNKLTIIAVSHNENLINYSKFHYNIESNSIMTSE